MVTLALRLDKSCFPHPSVAILCWRSGSFISQQIPVNLILERNITFKQPFYDLWFGHSKLSVKVSSIIWFPATDRLSTFSH